MIVKATSEYKKLKDSENFMRLKSASTHLKLLDGMEVQVPKALIPLPKKLSETLTEKKSSKKSESK